MDTKRGVWNDERELTNLLVVWAILWNVLTWFVISPALITRPGPPAFYAFDMGVGTLIWAAIATASLLPSLAMFLRVRKLRQARHAASE